MNAVWLVIKLVESHLDSSGQKKDSLGQGMKSEELSSNLASLKFKNRSNTALFNLISRCRLSEPEIFILLISVAVELVPTFGYLCSRYNGWKSQAYPTFELIASLFEKFDVQAIAGSSNLLTWGLLKIETEKDLAFNQSPIFIDSSILHYLMGIDYFDGRIRTVVNYVPSSQLKVQSISETHSVKTNQIVTELRRAYAEQYGVCFQLTGTDLSNKQSIVKTIATELRSGIIELSYLNVPIDTDQLHWLRVRLKRWQLIDNSLLYIKADQLRNDDHARVQTLRELISSMQIPVIISVDEPSDWGVDNTMNKEVDIPDETDQIALWRKHLGLQMTPELEQNIPQLVSQFNLSAPGIKTIASRFYLDTPPGKSTFDSLWDNCRKQARQKLDGLATRVTSNASWSNLILPANTKQQLATIIAQVKQRATVYQQFGFTSNRGSGITALFSGVSGTGKTTAAEVIANELKLDLYKIELSTVISKYIGETEKNLRKIFDAAQAGGAILLFDEADALFGKRTEVKDSKDRHSNAEISYLLQKMESYRGLAILTTNIKDALDSAFKRRLRFVVDFPFPDVDTREQIWRSVFPKQAPTHELNYQMLAKLNLSGGNIFSIALNSAFEAATDSEPIQMKHIVSAARYEA